MDKAFSLSDVLNLAGSRDALAWEPFREGVEVSWVYRADESGGASAAFLRYAPGASVPRHIHPGIENVLVLEGSQSDGNGRHQAGTLVVNPPGTEHAVHSIDGCVVLVFWEKPVRFV